MKILIVKRDKIGDLLLTTPTLSHLRAQGFDWVIVANGSESHRAIRRGVMTGARRVVAYAAEGSKYRRLTDPLAPRSDRHEADLLLDMLAPRGLAMPRGPAAGRAGRRCAPHRCRRIWLSFR